MKNNSKTFCLLVFFCGLNLFNTAFSEEIHGPPTHPPSHARASKKIVLSSFSGSRFFNARCSELNPQTSKS